MTRERASRTIVREATRADMKQYRDLCRRVWPRVGVDSTSDLAHFQSLHDQGQRTIVAIDAREMMVAGLTAVPVTHDDVDGYEINNWVVDLTRPDRLDLADAISLHALRIALSQAKPIVVTHRPKRITAAIVYGRDFLGMKTHDEITHILQVGDARQMVDKIIERHPEWRTLY